MGVGEVRWRVLGGSQFHGGGGRGGKVKEKNKNKNQKGRAVPLGPPIQYSLAPIKRAQSWVGVDVDYKGGGSCRMVDVGVCLGGRGTR